MLGPWWITFEDQTQACVEADGLIAAKAKAELATGKTVREIAHLPYAADPIIGARVPYIFQNKEVIQPTFCFKPNECAGHGSCPQSWSCTE